MTGLPRVATDTELTQMAYQASRDAANRQLEGERKQVGFAKEYARREVEQRTGVSADSFDIRYEASDRTFHFTLGLLELVARKPNHNSYNFDFHIHLNASVCPVCGEPLLSLALGNLDDLGSAIASLGESQLTGERPKGKCFDKATCKCTAQVVPDFDPQQDAINRLALALNDVLYMGGYPLGGQQ